MNASNQSQSISGDKHDEATHVIRRIWSFGYDDADDTRGCTATDGAETMRRWWRHGKGLKKASGCRLGGGWLALKVSKDAINMKPAPFHDILRLRSSSFARQRLHARHEQQVVSIV